MPSHSIAITGASGFIGRHLAQHLCDTGMRVLALTRTGSRGGFSTEIEEQALLLPDGIADWSVDQDIETLVHLGCETSVNQDFRTALESHVLSTCQLLDRCATIGIRRVVYVSSVAVFGTVRGSEIIKVDEDYPFAPESDYGFCKRMAELCCAEAARRLDLQVVIVRPGSVYGPGMHQDSVLPRFLAQAAKGKICIYGDGSRSQDFVHVADLNEAIRKVASIEEPAAIYNIGSGVGTSLLELANAINEILFKGEVSCRVLPEKPDDGLSMALDVRRAVQDLGYQPRDLRDGLRDFA